MSYYENDVLIDGAHSHYRRYIRRPAFFLSLVPVQSTTYTPVSASKPQQVQQRQRVQKQREQEEAIPAPTPVSTAEEAEAVAKVEVEVEEPVEAEAPVPHDHLRADSTSSTASVESTKRFLKLGPVFWENSGQDDYAVEG